MSNALKNAVESGASTLSDLVDDARSKIEDLPPLASRRKQSHKNWPSLFAAVLLGFVILVVAKQVRHHPVEAVPERNTL